MKINVSIDDVCPHPQAGIGVIERCFEILNQIPEAKFTIFVPTNYTRQGQKSYPLTKEFATWIRKKLPPKSFELGWHGHNHGIIGKSNNDEFQHLNQVDALAKGKQQFEAAEKVGLLDRFSPIFRPPAFRMSAAAIRAAEQVGIKVLCLSPKGYAKKTYAGAEDTFVENGGKVVYYTSNPPHDPLQLFAQTSIMFHACEWDRNYLDRQKAADLIIFLKQHHDMLEYCFMEDM